MGEKMQEKLDGIIIKQVQVNAGEADFGYSIVLQDGEYKLILWDLGPSGKKEIFDQLEKDIQKYNIKHVSKIFTHGHNDHTGGSAEFKRRFPELQNDKTILPGVYFNCYEALCLLEDENVELNKIENEESFIQTLAYAKIHASNNKQEENKKIDNIIKEYEKFYGKKINSDINNFINEIKSENPDIEQIFNYTKDNKKRFKNGEVIEGKETIILYGTKILSNNFVPKEFCNVLEKCDEKAFYKWFHLDMSDKDFDYNEKGIKIANDKNMNIDNGKLIMHYLTKEGGANEYFLSTMANVEWKKDKATIDLENIEINKYCPDSFKRIFKKAKKEYIQILEKRDIPDEERKQMVNLLQKDIKKEIDKELLVPENIVAILKNYSYKSEQNFYVASYSIEDSTGFIYHNRGDEEMLKEIQTIIEYWQAHEKKNEEKMREIEKLVVSNIEKDPHHNKATGMLPEYLYLENYILEKHNKNTVHIGSTDRVELPSALKDVWDSEERCAYYSFKTSITADNGRIGSCFIMELDDLGCQKCQCQKWLNEINNYIDTLPEEDLSKYALFSLEQRREGIDLKLWSESISVKEYIKACEIKKEIRKDLKTVAESLRQNSWNKDIPNLEEKILSGKRIEYPENCNPLCKNDIIKYNSLHAERKLYKKGSVKELFDFQRKQQEQEHKQIHGR